MKRICWITATYFLDVDLPVVPNLSEEFDIDWYIITYDRNEESDIQLIKSQCNCKFHTIKNNNSFFSKSCRRLYKSFLSGIKEQVYDWYYFDISDFLYLYPLIKKILPIEKITIATHNVSVPKGARLALLAKLSMRYITKNFVNFHVFSKNQQNVLLQKNPSANIFYNPLMLKNYGNKGLWKDSNITRFLFFGNIVKYKRVDILLEAVNILEKRGINNFIVRVCGYCKPDEWERQYKPLIYSSKIECDIRRIPNELVSEYFNDSDYFVMPYQDIAQSGAMTVALNYNIPIIASNLDTFKEFLSDNIDGYFFNNGCSYDLASVMEKAILNSKEQYLKLKSNQQEMVDKLLSKNTIINKYKDYFNNKINAGISY